jgi:hypothetical protein
LLLHLCLNFLLYIGWIEIALDHVEGTKRLVQIGRLPLEVSSEVVAKANIEAELRNYVPLLHVRLVKERYYLALET